MKTRIAVVLLLAALAFGLYRKVTKLWWTYDDAFTLHLVTAHSLAGSFFDREVWPQKLFTPLVNTAFEAQLAAFGLEPSRWYVVHLILLVATALALYAVLRIWFSVAASLTAAVLFIAAVPMCALIAVLGGTHYLQAIALGALSTMMFVRALRTAGRPSPRHGGEKVAEGRMRGAVSEQVAPLTPALSPPWRGEGERWVSALLYLLAMLAKEIAVPLIVLLAFLPQRKWRDLAPHAVALLVYLAWRRAVIGALLGGYGWAIAPEEWPWLIASLPVKIVMAWNGRAVGAGIALLLVMAIGVALAMRNRRAVLLILVAMALAVGPIVPVSKEMQPRYALVPWLVWSIAFVAGVDRMKRGKTVMLAAVCVLAIIANRAEWSHEYRKTRRMSDEAHFFFYMPPDGLLRAPSVPPAAMGELVWLQSYAGRPTGASWFFDDYFLCTGRANGKRIWQFDAPRRQVVEIAPPPCPPFRRDAPLTWQFRYGDGSLFWTLGPHETGRYRVLLGDGLQAFDVPRVGAFRLPDTEGLTVRLRYDSPDGWSTVSREIGLRFK